MFKPSLNLVWLDVGEVRPQSRHKTNVHRSVVLWTRWAVWYPVAGSCSRPCVERVCSLCTKVSSRRGYAWDPGTSSSSSRTSSWNTSTSTESAILLPSLLLLFISEPVGGLQLAASQSPPGAEGATRRWNRGNSICLCISIQLWRLKIGREITKETLNQLA